MSKPQLRLSKVTLLYALAAVFNPSCASLYAQPPAIVTTLAGQEFEGQLEELSDQEIGLRVGGAVQAIATSEVAVLSVPGVKVDGTESNPIEVLLTDGSTIRGSDLTGSNGGWKLSTPLLPGQSASIPKDLVSSVRFQPLGEVATKSWNDLLSSDRTGDVLTVLREGDLESLNGAILDITADVVEFELDGQMIQAPRGKVSGLIWLRRNSSNVSKAMDLLSKDGSRLRLKSLKLLNANSKPEIEIETLGGFRTAVPYEQVARLDYSASNLRWLDQLEVLESVSLSDLATDALKETRSKLLAPKFLISESDTEDSSTNSNRTNLVFDGPGRFVFRTPDGYTRLLTVIQRNRSAKVLSPAVVSIKCDDKVVWSQKLEGEVMRLDVQTNVEPNKKCEITVQSSDAIPVGLYTTFLQPHLLP